MGIVSSFFGTLFFLLFISLVIFLFTLGHECGFLMGLMLDVLPVAPFGFIIVFMLSNSGLASCELEYLQGDIRWIESRLKGCSSIIHFVLDSITFRKASNMLYCDIPSFQPMKIYVDDKAKLTLHDLVQVLLWKFGFWSLPYF